jgi:transposase
MPAKAPISQMSIVNGHAAGIDVGSREFFIALPAEQDAQPVRCFDTFTADIHHAAQWMKQCGITTVAMESTGIYWLPIFQILADYDFELLLVNARHVKNVTGRKSDMKDCQWIQKLHSYGLLTASFQPTNLERKLRSITRHRKNLIQEAAKQIQYIQKAFEQMNIKLHNVVSHLDGKSGKAIIEAILQGETDPSKLAALADRRIKASQEQIIKEWREEHIFIIRQSYDLHQFYHQKIEECDEQIRQIMQEIKVQAQLQFAPSTLAEPVKQEKPKRKPARKHTPGFDVAAHIASIVGVDLTAVCGISHVTALEILSEVGTDMSKFATAKHFTSWLGLAPNNKISGGKILSRNIQKNKNRAAHAFRIAANSLYRSKNALGDFFRRVQYRSGKAKAIVATARKLAVIFYQMVRNKSQFQVSSLEEYQKQYQLQKLKSLQKQLARLGYIASPISS